MLTLVCLFVSLFFLNIYLSISLFISMYLFIFSYIACKLNFEDGINNWEKTGIAFNNQPTYGDNPTARNSQPANQQGDWWIGSYENRPSKSAPAGKTQGDIPQGTLMSPYLTITEKYISFLIGGGCDIKLVRAELIIGNKVSVVTIS